MSEQAQLLKKSGLKVTLPRLKVLEIFEKSPEDHKSAEDVYKELLSNGSEVSIATVYRILMQFVDAGMLTKSNFGTDKAMFELNKGDQHDHLVCVHCGKVCEFTDDIIFQRQSEIAASHNFKLLERTMALYGICDEPACQLSAR